MGANNTISMIAKVTADTTEAQKSIKELAQQVQNIKITGGTGSITSAAQRASRTNEKVQLAQSGLTGAGTIKGFKAISAAAKDSADAADALLMRLQAISAADILPDGDEYKEKVKAYKEEQERFSVTKASVAGTLGDSVPKKGLRTANNLSIKNLIEATRSGDTEKMQEEYSDLVQNLRQALAEQQTKASTARSSMSASQARIRDTFSSNGVSYFDQYRNQVASQTAFIKANGWRTSQRGKFFSGEDGDISTEALDALIAYASSQSGGAGSNIKRTLQKAMGLKAELAKPGEERNYDTINELYGGKFDSKGNLVSKGLTQLVPGLKSTTNTPLTNLEELKAAQGKFQQWDESKGKDVAVTSLSTKENSAEIKAQIQSALADAFGTLKAALVDATKDFEDGDELKEGAKNLSPDKKGSNSPENFEKKVNTKLASYEEGGKSQEARDLAAAETAGSDIQATLDALIKAFTEALTKISEGLEKVDHAETEKTEAEEDSISEQANTIDSMQTKAEAGAKSARQMSESISGITDAAIASREEVSALFDRLASFGTLVGQVNVIKNIIRSAYNAVKELDEAMNSIAVVTDYTTQDMWDRIQEYTELASETGSTIAGAYQVAQLYYQQGLSDAEVNAATEETLKMARISNIDYSSATDYATAAIKGFNLDYTDLGHINDVYSNLAAKTAADTEEISIAMSKVASIANSTGMSLENTAAFLTQIIATTREAPGILCLFLKSVA